MFEDRKFSFAGLKKSLALSEFETQIDEARQKYPPAEAEKKIQALEEQVYEYLYHPESEDEYLQRMTENGVDIQMYLMDKPAILKSNEIYEIQSLMHRNIYKKSEIDGRRKIGFFNDIEGRKQMCPGDKILHELDVLDKQIETLEKNAHTKEEKFKIACFSAMRVFTIHPSNDGNKRIVKMMMNHAVKNIFNSTSVPAWHSIDKNVIKQAVFGNNIGPFMNEMQKLYKLELDVDDMVISPFSIFHSMSTEKFGLDEELKDSQIYEVGEGFRSERGDVVNVRVSTLKEMRNELKVGFFSKKKTLVALEKLAKPMPLAKFLIESKKLFDKKVINDGLLNRLVYPQLQAYYGETYLHRDVMKALKEDRFAKVERIIKSYENPPRVEALNYRNIDGKERSLNIESKVDFNSHQTQDFETEIDNDIGR